MITVHLILLMSILSSKLATSQSLLRKKGLQEEEVSKNDDVGNLVTLILETYLKDCGTMLVKDGTDSWVSLSIIRAFTRASSAYTIFDLETTSRITSLIPTGVRLQRRMRIEERLPCQVFVVDLTNSRGSSLAIQFLENLQLFLIPNAYVIFLGRKALLEDTLRAKILRNSVHVLYLVIKLEKQHPEASIMGVNSAPNNSTQTKVTIFSRCLFCDEAENGIEKVNIWKSSTGFRRNTSLLKDEMLDMKGHKLRIVQVAWVPLVAYSCDQVNATGLVTPLDSVHVRALRAIAKSLNFTYEMREPSDGQWGVSTPSGNWTGMVGTMQHHKADFALSVTYSWSRSHVIDYTRIMLKEPFGLVMSKPKPRPPYLALVNPFTAEVWMAALLSTVSVGVILWCLQLGWKRVSNEAGMTLNVALLQTWSVQFEEPATIIPKNASSLVFLGAWWIYCLFILSMYKSSLVAHLTVPGKSNAIDSFEELLEDGGWTWGSGHTHTNQYDLLKTSDNPVMKKIFEGMEIQPIEEQAVRILREKHALLVAEYLFKSLKVTIAKTRGGISPYYFGKTHYFVNGDGWAFRRNAPYYDAIDMKIQQLDETGHITQWLKQLIGTTPDDDKENLGKEETVISEEQNSESTSTGQVVLTLNHLQSAFYLFSMGIFVSILAFVGEMTFHGLKNLVCLAEGRKGKE
ncbi:glutamate receptor ionotropic, kainate 3-like [Palaemon carinicauda]|uniref:glutamate receptor ionotropic, kainate 3-like n=1 Tax=Palaemon carinicauda TaxID=392227 RepID=UPI0035B5EAA6